MAVQLLNDRLDTLIRHLRCPRCRRPLEAALAKLECPGCSRTFGIEAGIPLLLLPENRTSNPSDVTEKIRAFYEEHPFPDYEAFDDLAALLEKAGRGIFAKLLDEQIPFGARVLECGCGTGQLTNFLSIAHRTVIGTDLSRSSLRLGEEFRQRHSLNRAYFVQMSLFEPVFEERFFDFVICNGVLHHTGDPKGGYRELVKLLKPGGFIVIGLYHRFGRIFTDLRRILFRAFGDGPSFLDPRLRDPNLGGTRKRAWFADQYRNPHESKHTIGEVLEWIRELDLEFIRSIPDTRFFNSLSQQDRLFEPQPGAGPIERRLREFAMGFQPSREGGFFTVIARRKPCPS